MTGKGYVDPETGEIHVPDDDPAPPDNLPEVVDQLPAVPAKALPPKLAAMLQDATDRTMQDPEDIARSIVERILSATSAEEVLAQQDVRHAREILGEAVVVEGVRFNTSDFGDGFGFYMLADVVDHETGAKSVVSCGGRTVMAQLYRLAELNAFPCKVKFRQPDKPTRQGFYPLWLEPA